MNRWLPMRILAGAAVAPLLLAGCGQKGPLYLPDQATEIVTRPTQTPAETAPATPPPASSDAPNTPQTMDTPPGPGNPAPEVTTPPAKDTDKDKKEPGAQPPR